MMRLCCLSLSFQPQFQAKQMDDLAFIDFCGHLQLEGVDLNMRSLSSLEPNHLRKIKKACLERGLSIACIGINNDFGRPPQDQEAVHRDIRTGIDAARLLGAPVVRVFAGYVHEGDARGSGSGPSRVSGGQQTMPPSPALWPRCKTTITTTSHGPA